ncbi:MAG: hypothetical protein LBL13_06320 [Bacteroidales bacterium]|jgi:hypothetical protein|nr:hypothetical protein [Bacteroidales bacterium]
MSILWDNLSLIRVSFSTGKMAASNRQQATGRQAAGRQATRKKTKHADNADFIGFSQIRKKICGHLH